MDWQYWRIVVKKPRLLINIVAIITEGDEEEEEEDLKIW